MIASPALWSLRWEDPLTQKLLWSVFSIVMIYGLALLTAQLLHRTVKDPLRHHKSRKFVYYTGTGLTALVLLGIWSES